jgi:hypothetical protein
MLRSGMRPSYLWYLIAAFWLFDTGLTAARHGWRAAWLKALIAGVFAALGLIYRNREKRALSGRKQP